MKILLKVITCAILMKSVTCNNMANYESITTLNDMPIDSSQQELDDPSKIFSRNSDLSRQFYATHNGYPSYGPPTTSYSQYSPPNYYSYGTPEKKRPSPPSPPSPTHSTYPSLYYLPAHETVECTEVMTGGVITDVLNNAGVHNFGVLRPIVAAITAGILAKIPIILAVKALILKLILMPLGFIILSLPIILPIVLLFFPWWSKIKETFSGTTTAAPPAMVMFMPVAGNNTNATAGGKGRALDYGQDIFTAVMESDRCFEKLACSLGSRDADMPFTSAISWLLKFLQSLNFVQRNMQIRSMLKRYRDAYLQGVTATAKFNNETNSTTADMETFCSDRLYPCSSSTLYSKPELVGFSRYL